MCKFRGSPKRAGTRAFEEAAFQHCSSAEAKLQFRDEPNWITARRLETDRGRLTSGCLIRNTLGRRFGSDWGVGSFPRFRSVRSVYAAKKCNCSRRGIAALVAIPRRVCSASPPFIDKNRPVEEPAGKQHCGEVKTVT